MIAEPGRRIWQSSIGAPKRTRQPPALRAAEYRAGPRQSRARKNWAYRVASLPRTADVPPNPVGVSQSHRAAVALYLAVSTSVVGDLRDSNQSARHRAI